MTLHEKLNEKFAAVGDGPKMIFLMSEEIRRWSFEVPTEYDKQDDLADSLCAKRFDPRWTRKYLRDSARVYTQEEIGHRTRLVAEVGFSLLTRAPENYRLITEAHPTVDEFIERHFRQHVNRGILSERSAKLYAKRAVSQYESTRPQIETRAHQAEEIFQNYGLKPI